MNKKICKICLKEKDICNFYKNTAQIGGYESRCKQCKKLGLTIYNTNEPKYPRKNPLKSSWEQEFNVKAACKEDYMLMYDFLEKIGYNRNQVHLDFCEKYNLKPGNRNSKNENLYLPNGEINPKSYVAKYRKKIV